MMAARREARECFICGHAPLEPLYPGILRCANCGHARADLRLSDEELLALYDRNYFCGGEYDDYAADQEVLQKNFRARLRALRRFLRPERHRRLMEIGSAYGFFLDVARADFASMQGFEIAASGARHAREKLNLDVVQADFLNYDLGGRQYDVVCLWDTIEHLRDPQAYLRKISQSLASGALLALTTGDIESLNARLRKGRWRLLHPPTHLHYFSGRSLSRLLADCGFEVIYHKYCGQFRSVANVARNLLAARRKTNWLALRPNSRGGRIGFYLNLYDIMYVIARKR